MGDVFVWEHRSLLRADGWLVSQDTADGSWMHEAQDQYGPSGRVVGRVDLPAPEPDSDETGLTLSRRLEILWAPDEMTPGHTASRVRKGLETVELLRAHGSVASTSGYVLCVVRKGSGIVPRVALMRYSREAGISAKAGS